MPILAFFGSLLGLPLLFPYFFISVWPDVPGSTMARLCLCIPDRDPGGGWASARTGCWPSGLRKFLICWSLSLASSCTFTGVL